MASYEWPPQGSGSGSGVPIYTTFSAFPSAASVSSGSLAVAADTGILYESNAIAWRVIGGPGVPLSIGSPANGLSVTATVLSLGLSSASTIGALSSTDWSTFNAKQAALTFGNLTDAGTDGITVTGGTGAVIGSGTSIAQRVSDSTHNGYLSSTDWSTFNAKQDGPLTGDVTTSGAAATLATVNSNVGSFGSSTAIPAFTVNAKGLITAASSSAVIAPAGTLTGTTLASNVVTSSLTAVGTILTGTWSATTIAVNKGGTGATSLTLNNVVLGNGTSAVQFVAPGSSGNVLQSNGTTWISAAPAAATYTAPKITRYTSGSATHTITGSPLYVRFVVVGGGGGGGAGGPSGTGNSGTAGGNSTVASTLIVANGGALGVRANSTNNSSNYAAGGAGTVNSPAITIKNITGGSGGGAGDGHSISGVYAYGGAGGVGPLGGNGQIAAQNQQPGVAGIANTGGGGGGGSANSANGVGRYGGYGGAAGAYVEAQVNAADLTATYAIVVGAAGAGGTTADGDGANGANAGSGLVEITEYYQ